MFNKISPEKAGVSSRSISDFINTLDSYNINTHSIIMAKGDNIIAETYYKPFNKDTLHRMYSVSKSFVSIAIGLAEQEGLLSLDDKFNDYFPEYQNQNIDKKYRETTIRDMLTMRSCMAKYSPWWETDDRAKAYFDVTSNQISGTNFSYDSSGSFILGCIVEKVTGMPYLEYLKEKVLLEIGFSKESYCLLAPGGHSHSDSGVMCTPRDLLIFARFVMNKGVWNGKRYINEEFITNAISKQTDNNISGIPTPLYNKNGYGYLIWKMPRDGFGFIGMANQLAICDPKTDFIFIMTGENMVCEDVSCAIILHELYKNIIEKISDTLPEDEKEYRSLCEVLDNRNLIALNNSLQTNIQSKIQNKKYVLEENEAGIKYIKLKFKDDTGTLEFEKDNKIREIEFGIGFNKFGKFPQEKRIGLTASVYENGSYTYAASGEWCEENKLHILVRIIDTYLGTLSIVLGFKDNGVTLTMKKFSQRILDDYEVTASGYTK